MKRADISDGMASHDPTTASPAFSRAFVLFWTIDASFPGWGTGLASTAGGEATFGGVVGRWQVEGSGPSDLPTCHLPAGYCGCAATSMVRTQRGLLPAAMAWNSFGTRPFANFHSMPRVIAAFSVTRS